MLSTLLKKHRVESNLKFTVVALSQEFCNAALEYNVLNRPISKARVKLYASEMLNGRWNTNGEPLIFGVTDNGLEVGLSLQHRLHAYLECCGEIDKANSAIEDKDLRREYPYIEVPIITGVNASTADTQDLGMTRTHTDVLFRESWLNDKIAADWNKSAAKRKTWVKVLAGAARLVWLRRGGAAVSSAPKFLVSEMLEFVKYEHPGLTEFVNMVLDINSSDGGNGGLKMSLAYVAALTYVAALDEDGKIVDERADKIQDFLTLVATGSGFGVGTVAHALTGYWNHLVSQPGSKDRDREWTGPFVKALKLVLADDQSQKIKPQNLALTKKEAENYTISPPLFDGWDTWAFEQAAIAKMVPE